MSECSFLCCKPLYAISTVTSSTTPEDYDEASILRYLRLFVAVTMDFENSLSQDDHATEPRHISEHARRQYRAITNVKLLIKSIKEAASVFLETSNIVLGRYQVMSSGTYCMRVCSYFYRKLTSSSTSLHTVVSCPRLSKSRARSITRMRSLHSR